MTDTVEPRLAIAPVTLPALFAGFLQASLFAFGGGMVWVRRMVVEQRRWLGDIEFAEILGLCQFMPGPNIVGIATCIGTRLHGAAATTAPTAPCSRVRSVCYGCNTPTIR